MNLTIDLTHTHRRMIAVGFVASLLGSLVLHVFTSLFGLTVALQGLGLLCAGVLLAWGASRFHDQHLDERQLQIRNGAYFRAYLILSVLALALPVAMLLLVIVSEPMARALTATVVASLARPVDVLTLLGVLAPLVGLLPLAMLAWIEPEPLGDEVGEPVRTRAHRVRRDGGSA